jgi:hypothetical protein
MTPEAIHAAVLAERARQGAKWGGPHPWGMGDCSSHAVADTTKAAVLAEECGEAARAVLDQDKDGLRLELEGVREQHSLSAAHVASLQEEQAKLLEEVGAAGRGCLIKLGQ